MLYEEQDIRSAQTSDELVFRSLRCLTSSSITDFIARLFTLQRDVIWNSCEDEILCSENNWTVPLGLLFLLVIGSLFTVITTLSELI